jgi:hypothetical protein
MKFMRRLWWVMTTLAACGGSDKVQPDGGSGPVDAAIDGAPDAVPDAAIDAPPGPPLAVQISKGGSDLYDGINMPVETLRRGIEIAAANPRVTTIGIGSGTYSARSGETFPYQIPANVVIVGLGVLVGTGTETGLLLGDGQLQGLTLDHFNVAVKATGKLRIKDVKIVNSATGIHGARTAKLRIDNLEITGPTSACSTGILLEGELFATTVITNDLAPVIDANNPGPIDIAKARIVGRPGCGKPPVNVTGFSGTFALSDSDIDGANAPAAVNLVGVPATSAQATITATSVHSARTGVAATGVSLKMTGGAASGNRAAGFEAHDGSYTLDGVQLAGNNQDNGDEGINSGAVVVSGSATTPTTLVVRNCSLFSNSFAGFVVKDHALADLGTTASPGNNRLQFNDNLPVNLAGAAGQSTVTAVGNTWKPNTQGSDAAGHYAPQLIQEPVAVDFSNNFAVAAGWRLQL